uniref:Uncharacterized protein n=1 Tax=Oryza sativa subsp. japonica TaxID=39947 RepID=Q656C4_ORYSJ|nr:hypothetical protein [Oryza sativa Japonica Group]
MGDHVKTPANAMQMLNGKSKPLPYHVDFVLNLTEDRERKREAVGGLEMRGEKRGEGGLGEDGWRRARMQRRRRAQRKKGEAAARGDGVAA